MSTDNDKAKNIVWQEPLVSKTEQARLINQNPTVFWFTGLSGSGKTTIGHALHQYLHERKYHVVILDGDNIRHGLNKDLGFTETDRIENIRRVAEVAKLFLDAGLIVIVTFISPFQRDREMARTITKEYDFIDVYMSTPLSVCESRDPKGLYKKARAGELANFTGIDSIYEAPKNPMVSLDTSKMSVEESIRVISSFCKFLKDENKLQR